MKNLNCVPGIKALTAAAAVAATATGAFGQATTLTLNSAGGYYNGNVGMISPTGQNLGNENFGVYSFTVNAIDQNASSLTGLTVGSDFLSVCLSPTGTLYFDTQYTYNYESFNSASPGINPPGQWSPNGIQNAAYLWDRLAGTLQNSDQGVGLSMAMLEVLYNGGNSYGTLDNSRTLFVPNFNGDTTAQNAYNDDLNYYTANAGSSGSLGEAANTQTYGIFVPTASEGQEFIFISPNGMNGGPVPESPTVIAGALLVLPFGASALRVLRTKNRASA